MLPPFVTGADRRGSPVLSGNHGPPSRTTVSGSAGNTVRGHRRPGGAPDLKPKVIARYFFLRAPDRFAALKEMPARMAFC
jgi:hypothetical protein